MGYYRDLAHVLEVKFQIFSMAERSILVYLQVLKIVATTNATQVLLATGTGNLIYLEVLEGSLTKVKHLAIEFDVSYVDINPIADNPVRSECTAVGLWRDNSINVYSLPDLHLITRLQFE